MWRLLYVNVVPTEASRGHQLPRKLEVQVVVSIFVEKETQAGNSCDQLCQWYLLQSFLYNQVPLTPQTYHQSYGDRVRIPEPFLSVLPKMATLVKSHIFALYSCSAF